MPNTKAIIVTGANRGIGRAICNLILSRRDGSQLTLYATSRKGENLGFDGDAHATLVYPELDISNKTSITAFANKVKQSGGTIDVLINNAGVNFDKSPSPYEAAKATLDVNYRGTLEMSRAFLPLLRPNGRIVNLSSVASSLRGYSEEVSSRFRTVGTLDEVERLAGEYEAAVQSGTEEQAGFPTSRSYGVSKACINSATAILSRQNPSILINACCPGWIDTDMGVQVSVRGTRPPKTMDQGAKIPVRLALDDIGGVTGKFWANDSIRDQGEGKVQEW